MKVVMQVDGQFGYDGPGKGSVGRAIGFVVGGEHLDETELVVLFDEFPQQTFYVPPKFLGIASTGSDITFYVWLEKMADDVPDS